MYFFDSQRFAEVGGDILGETIALNEEGVELLVRKLEFQVSSVLAEVVLAVDDFGKFVADLANGWLQFLVGGDEGLEGGVSHGLGVAVLRWIY